MICIYFLRVFSPPAYNLFELIHGFRGIKGGGASYNQPACAAHNVWWNIFCEGYDGSPHIFVNHGYSQKSSLGIFIGSLRHAAVTAIQNRKLSVKIMIEAYNKNADYLNRIPIDRKDHFKLFKSSIISGYRSDNSLKIDDAMDEYIYKENINGESLSFPISLFSAQKEVRLRNAKKKDSNSKQ